MRVVAVGLIGIAFAGCGISSGRYRVSASPFDFVGKGLPGICVAVDPSNPQGVWWWEPGRTGCSSRSTGPELFPGWKASVDRTSGVTHVRFELPLIVSDPLQVKLTLEGASMRYETSGQQVKIERRRKLDIPESCCPQPLTSR
jgi:hypothetical protein